MCGKPKYCDLCEAKFSRIGGGTFEDGKTKRGPWANMCEHCFNAHGVGLGTGKGQRYNSKTGEKIAG